MTDKTKAHLPVTPEEYLIRKGGAYYRPNAAGYTNNVDEAGRYTLAEAIRHSHPNGPDGPRDGIDYMPAPARQSHSLLGEAEWLNLMPREIVARAALNEGCRDKTANDIRSGLHGDVKIRAEVAVKLIGRIQEECFAALTPSPCPGDGWLSIDTAPRDGTWFIADGGGCERPTPMKWNNRIGAWECDAVMLEDWDDQTEGYSRPERWWPIPAAPKEDNHSA